MTNIHIIADKISLSVGLATALNKMAWSIANVAPEDTAALKSVLSLGEILETELNTLYNSIKEELWQAKSLDILE